MGQPNRKPLTLLDLTSAVIEVSADDREAVATLAHLIRSGRVKAVRRGGAARPLERGKLRVSGG